ncbi:glycoside hydrolase family 53 protein [Cohnella nanjingensis]|uniref:Arabinogalactan endo-beta-1,4-galactanase n=1 Tax=Cohnella nanjingensis TaxID=1387779 RepID=A0A7X0RP41_9BACL|nr:glycosyl hydrolase 53 family protein [Cohnella nanjingensis]MBB6671069.1 glycosyl hydrolase 53 family protein [Cohnella nanjingensis]
MNDRVYSAESGSAESESWRKCGFTVGMDVSFLDEVEQAGGAFYDWEGRKADLLRMLRDHGTTAVRLRIWHVPPGGYCNLERTIVMARRIKSLGLRFLLDFHYSDRWADPANQHKPAAWAGLDETALREAARGYTRDVLTALSQQNAAPDMVQIGNEITPGMLWDDGRVDGDFDTDTQWEKLAGLVRSGMDGAKDALPDVRIMIHIDRGGDLTASERFFDRIAACGIADFDCIGLSYYPWWHGTLEDLRHTLGGLAKRYGKPVNVVETAYPWTLDKREGLDFIVHGEAQLLAGYPATEEGQASYLRDFIRIVRETAGGLGDGFYWWEPAWTPAKTEWSVGHGNNWSNLTLVDFEGRPLQALQALRGR